VHSYLANETAALLQNRLGLEAALRSLRETGIFEIHWVGPEDHASAVEYLSQAGRRRLRLVDCMSFVIMRQRGIRQALSFDERFVEAGFRSYS